MSGHLSDSLLAELSALLDAATGLHFPHPRWHDLERGLRHAADEFGFSDLESCARWLLSSTLTRPQIEILAGHLTVGETYFYRDRRIFEVLEQHVLPELIQQRRGGERRLRIWSAACCTGEEVYSLVISLRKSLPDAGDWDVSVLGSDINPVFLAKAARGVFSEWSFRSAPKWLKGRFFTEVADGKWEVRPEIKQLARFRHLNLAEDVYPSPRDGTQGMDVIFCRNVLIYFSPDQAQKVLLRLYRCLRPGGWLVLSPGESPRDGGQQFMPVNIEGTILYQKVSAGTRPVEMWPERKQQRQPALSARGPAPKSTSIARALQIDSSGRKRERSASPRVTASEGESTSKKAVVPIADAAKPGEMLLQARALANSGHLTEALHCCDQALAADKLDESAHYLRATILLERGTMDGAAAALRRVLYLDPEFVLAHFALGNLARTEGNLQEAEKHWKNALALVRRFPPDEIVPQSDGLSAGRLAETIEASMKAQKRPFQNRRRS